jgi:glycosyltransferase involved in cell wall biosynthesis
MPQIGIGGAELQLCALIAHSDPREIRHEVLYYSASRDDEALRLYRESGVCFAQVPRNRFRPLRFLANMARAIRQRQPDIVHTWLFSGLTWGRVAALRAGCPRIIAGHRTSILPYARAVCILELLTGNRINHLANSRAGAAAIARQIGVSLERFSVIPNGIDLNSLNVDPDREGLRREFGIPLDCRIVLTIGRLTDAKDYPMLLRIARRCRGRLPVRFLVAGHGEMEVELRQMARELNVSDMVHFAGLRLDTPRLLKSSDLFCYTSWYEGFPNALLEAMAAGLPVVTTAFAGADELIEDGVSGRIVACRDDAAACEVLESMLRDEPEARVMGERARCVAAERFSMQAMVRRMTDYYRRLMACDCVLHAPMVPSHTVGS